MTIHTDGGARGNPGPGACAFIVEHRGKIVGKGTKFLGSVTNNFAEYSGVYLAISWLTENFSPVEYFKPIIIFMDSELVVRQLGGLYRIKNDALIKLSERIKSLIEEKKMTITFKHILRSKNKIADLLVNEELDRNT